MENVIIRSKTKSDEDFIFHTWLNHYQANSYFAKRIKKPTFMRYHSIVANQIMEREFVKILIAGDEDFTIFGYIIAEDLNSSPVIHFCYVRPEYQRLGIATKLFRALGIDKPFEISHWTPPLNSICQKYNIGEYNPYRM